MKTRSADFDPVWAGRVKHRVWKVELLRRYWNGSAYVLEGSPITLREHQVVNISPITRRFERGSGLRVTNVTLTLKNHDQEWLPSNTTTGRWAPDNTALLGYDLVNSEVRIYAGYKLDDGTEEMLPQFTGVIGDEPVFDETQGTAAFILVGLAEAKMKSANPKNVCVTITDGTTTPAQGNGTNRIFDTGLKSLWDLRNVREAGTPRVQGDEEDYTPEDLNDAEISARIEFNTGRAPANLAPILYDGRQWHRDKSASEAIALLCDEAGIQAADRIIEEPVFTGVDQYLDIAASVWTTVGPVISGGDFETAGDLTSWTPTTSGTGSITRQGPLAGTPETTNWNGDYYVQMAASGGSGTKVLRAQLIPAAGTTITKDIDPTAVDPDTGTNRRFICAGSEGPYTLRLIFLWGGVEYARITAPATTASPSVEFYAWSYNIIGIPEAPPSAFVAVDYIREINTVESPEQDMLAAPVEWLPLVIGNATIRDTHDIFTKVANASGGPYDADVAVDATLVPQSALKRYAVIVIEALEEAMKIPGTTARLNWRGGELFIKSLDFTDFENCLDAAQAIADFCGMDQGTTDDGKYFFKNRTALADSPDMVLDQSNAVMEITGLTMGFREVKNVIQVRYGKSGERGYYFVEYKAADAGDTSPTSEERFGARVREIVMDQFLFSNNASVAEAIAAKAYSDDHLPKRRGKAPCRFIPQLDARDVVELSFHRSPLIQEQIYGDPLQTTPAIGGATNTILRDVPVRVVGKTDDIIQGKTLLDWEEILT